MGWNGTDKKSGRTTRWLTQLLAILMTVVLLTEVSAAAATYPNGEAVTDADASVGTQYAQGDVPRIYVESSAETGAYLTTTNGKSPYQNVSKIVVVDKQDGSCDTVIDTVAEDGSLTPRVKIRGNSTAYFRKKPYNIKLTASQSLLGMHKAKTWVLLANHVDATLLRNYLALDMAKFMGIAHTSEIKIVEVYLNDDLLGAYHLVEKIDAKVKPHIDVNQGEFLVELTHITGEEGVVYITPDITVGNSKLQFELQIPDELTEEQKQHIKETLEAVIAAMKSNDFSQVQSLVDVESFAKVYVLAEYLKSIDNDASLFYYFKDGKLYAGPPWDFDLSAGNISPSNESSTVEGLTHNVHLNALLLQYPEFRAMVQSQYNMIKQYDVSSRIDEWLEEYGDALRRNFTPKSEGGAGWVLDNTDYIDYRRKPELVYEDNIPILKEWFPARAAWLDANLPAGAEHQHSLQKIESEAAACTKDGHGQYWVCSLCQKLFTDESANQETTIEAQTLPRLDHRWGSDWLYDSENHWQDCDYDCGTINNRSAHTYGGDSVCTTCSYRRVSSHTHSYGRPTWNWVTTPDYAAEAVFTCISPGCTNPPQTQTVAADITVDATSPEKRVYTGRVSFQGESFHDAKIETITLSVKEPTPAALIDFSAETLTGLTADSVYRIDGADVASNDEGVIPLNSGWLGKTLSIVKTAPSASSSDSDAQILTVPDRPNPPAGVPAVSKTANSLSIANTDAFPDCEYSLDGQMWQDSGVFSGLTAAQTYVIHIRVKSTANAFSSAIRTQTASTDKSNSSGGSNNNGNSNSNGGNNSNGNSNNNHDNKDNNDDKPSTPATPDSPPAQDPDDPPAHTFSDVTAGWYYDSVSFVVTRGLFNGVSDTSFSPHTVMNRGMLATVLWRMEQEPDASPSNFPDVANDQYYVRAVAWAFAEGVITGYRDGSFGPNDPVTREQLCTMLYRYAERPQTQGSISVFADAGQVSAYASDAMRWAVERGIIQGKNGDRLDPQGQATRAEVAAMVMRYCQMVPSSPAAR